MPFETQDSNGRRKVSAIITNAAGTTVDPVAARRVIRILPPVSGLATMIS